MPWDRGIFRIGGPAPRPRRGPGRPCDPATVERVRALWVGSRRTREAIGLEVGVSPITVWKWARAAGWTRPPFSPGPAWSRSPDAWEAWRRRGAAGRAEAAALRILDELEADPALDLPGLAGVMELLEHARELQGAALHRRPPATTLSACPPGSGPSVRSG